MYYRAFGLTLCSELALPELIAVDSGDADVQVRRAEVCSFATESPGGTRLLEDGSYVIWNLAGFLLVREGREILVEDRPGFDPALVRMLLLGRCIGALLTQRGWLVLHASAVALGGRAHAFVGASGAGKSTAAAALHAAGGAVVADDLLPVRWPAAGSGDLEGAPYTTGGFPQLKLAAAPAMHFGVTSAPLPPWHPEVPERYYAVSRGFTEGAVPLAAVHVLVRGGPVRAEPLPEQQACLELLRASYAADLLTGAAAHKRHFFACAALVEQVPVSRLYTGDTLSEVARAAALVQRAASR